MNSIWQFIFSKTLNNPWCTLKRSIKIVQACLGPPMQVAGTSWNRSNSKRIGCTGCINLNVILYHVHGHWISCLRLEFTNFCLKTNFKCEYDRNIPSLFLIILWMSKFVCTPKLCLKFFVVCLFVCLLYYVPSLLLLCL